ncbi:hypothetical protein Vretimale_17814 [Volvox reticuliferus]|uniref:Uncharacterized protein n=1 Tax=Volvox reticuliferus TaxID=1737510 RepID=A0A8J4LY96_9CHLO|nr:hypothetical protein Vretifemale_19031 [Volvox reticuliferus]GIM14954.1 hypothetical protein Vretimale_17814 [Volvox reticuliferus]
MRRIGPLFILFLSVSSCIALNYVFDEYLFSKDTWLDWKVENPLAGINPSDLLPKAKESFPGYDQAEFNSLDGTNPRLPPSQKILSLGGGLDLDPLDEENFLEPAAKAAQCTTCHVLMGVVWSRLTASVLGGVNIRASVVRGHLMDACEKDALDAVLRKYSILKMDTGSESTMLTFFVVRERRNAGGGQKASGGDGGGNGPTEAEEEAVELSCKTLVRDHGADLTSVLMTQLANYRREALRLLVKHGRDGGSMPEEAAPAAATEDGRGPGGSGSRGQLPRLDLSERVPSLDQDIGEDDDDDYVDPDDLDEKGNVSERESAKEKPAADGKRAAGAATKQSAGSRAVGGLVVKGKGRAYLALLEGGTITVFYN